LTICEEMVDVVVDGKGRWGMMGMVGWGDGGNGKRFLKQAQSMFGILGGGGGGVKGWGVI